mgnify:CR=1 FL=1
MDLGSDQTSLHNPWQGGYFPADINFENAKKMMLMAVKLLLRLTLKKSLILPRAQIENRFHEKLLACIFYQSF